MAGTNDLNIALKITADLSSGQEALKSFESDLKSSGSTATEQQKKIEEMTLALEQSLRSIADYQKRTENGKTTSIVDTDAIEQQQAALQKLLGQIDPVEKKLAQLDAMEQQLHESRKAGVISLADYNDALAKIGAQRDSTYDKGFDSQTSAVQRLLAEIDPLEKKLARLDELEQRLAYQQQTGAIDSTTYAEAIEKINQQRERAVQTAEKQRAAQDTEAIAAQKAADETLRQQTATQRLLAEIDPLAGKLAQLADRENRLNEAYKSGAIDAEQYAKSLQKINQQREQLNKDTPSSVSGGGLLSSGIGKFAAPLAAAFSIKEIAQRSDEMKNLNNRLRTVTSTSDELVYATNRVAEAALSAQRPLELTGELYQRIATNGDKLKLTYNDIGSLTETISKSVSMSGLSEGLARSMTEQIGRIFATGTLKQTQFNRVLRQTPALAQAIADGMGITVEALMAMSAKGKLELEDITNALKDQADNVSKKYADMETTMGAAFSALGDSLTMIIGKLDRATGASNALAQGILHVAQSISNLSDAPGDLFRNGDEKSIGGARFNIADYDLQIKEKQKQIADLPENRPTISAKLQEDLTKIQEKRALSVKRLEELSGSNSIAAQLPAAKGGANYNEALETYIDNLEKAQKKVNNLSKEEQARADIASGTLFGNQLSEADKERTINAAKLADQTKAQTDIEKGLNTLRKNNARADSQNTQQGIIEYEIKNGWLKNATKAEQDEARAIAAKTDALRKSNGETGKATNENERYVKSLTDLARKKSTAPAAIREEDIATRNLTASQQEQALAAHAAISARENQEQNIELQIQLWKATGQAGVASAAEIEVRYKALFDTLTQSGNIAGLALAKANKAIELAKIPVVDAQSSMDRVLSEQSRQEQSIQAQQQAGLISSFTARERLLELHRATRIELEKQLPILEEAAAKTGDPAIIERLANVKQQIQELGLESNIWLSTLQSGIEGGLNSAFNGMITNTMNLREALNALAQGVVQQFSQMASQNLSNIISSGIGNLFSGMVDTGADTAAKTAADVSGSTMYATAITTSTTAGATVLGTTLASSFTVGAAQIAAAMQAGAVSSGIGAASAAAFASGGPVFGPGTGTSDSISAKLSNGEFVVRASAVQQYGVSFLHSINNQQVRHFADGGIVSPLAAPANANAAYSWAADGRSGAGSSSSSPVIQQTLVLDAGDAVSKGISTQAGSHALLTYIQSNRETIKQELGV